jgi:hypothetical protein
MKKLFILLLFPFLGCEKENVICTTEFRSYSLYVKDTLEYVKVVNIDNGNTLYSDSNVYPEFKVVDDSYLNVIGENQRAALNIRFRYVNDTIHQRIYPICLSTDECHVYISTPHDTLI